MTPSGNRNQPVHAVRLAANPAFRHATRGRAGAPILVVCDPPSWQAYNAGLPTSIDTLRRVAESIKAVGLSQQEFLFVSLCPPLPEDAYSSASRKWRHVQPYVEGVLGVIEANNPKCVVTFGELSSRAVLGRAVKITKSRGQTLESAGRIVVPMLSPAFIAKVPEHGPTFDADWLTVLRLKESAWQVSPSDQATTRYEWCEDLSELLANLPALIAVDTETTGLVWHDDSVRVLTVQISFQSGHSLVCPVDAEYWPNWHSNYRGRARLIRQLKTLLENPSVKKVGHNLKFDVHMLRKLDIQVQGWEHDTQLMAFAVDENMLEKSLDECVRRWVPALAGYNDLFNQTVDKSQMLQVPHDQMLVYAGGDTDATLRLYTSLLPLVVSDRQQFNCYARILMPTIATFADKVEPFGMQIDVERLRSFYVEVSAWMEEEYAALIRAVPAPVRRKYLEAREEMSFSRAKFVRDILFSETGFNLTPVVFTKTTASLPEHEREPSTSTKDHLPFFTDRDDAAGDFVRRLIDYQKTEKLLSTYIGKESDGNGLWQYISTSGSIHPSYMLHKTVTGRSASANPNGQNFPKRGRWAKSYQKIFVARPGFKLVSVDLSQIELRIAAWMSRDARMLSIYRQDGDIHTATAKASARLTDQEWEHLSRSERKLLRTKAKAVNFGFLYGMGWKKFRSFAKTDYGVDYSEHEAQTTRQIFFATYAALEGWHRRMRDTVKRERFVRALHGARRNLPSIASSDEVTRQGAERQAINSPVQRFGSDLGLIALTRFSRQANPDNFRIIGFIHDALVMEVRDGFEKEGIEALLWVMENPPLTQWFGIRAPLPIRAEAEIGLNAGEMLEFSELPDLDARPEWFRQMGFDAVTAAKPAWWDDALDDHTPEILSSFSQASASGS